VRKIWTKNSLPSWKKCQKISDGDIVHSHCRTTGSYFLAASIVPELHLSTARGGLTLCPKWLNVSCSPKTIVGDGTTVLHVCNSLLLTTYFFRPRIAMPPTSEALTHAIIEVHCV